MKDSADDDKNIKPFLVKWKKDIIYNSIINIMGKYH